LVIGLLFLVGLAGPAPSQGPVYGVIETPLIFDHARHAALGLTCERCHSTAKDSVRPADRLLPPESVCFECHAPAEGPAAADGCATCHPGYRPASMPAEARNTALARPYPAPIVRPLAQINFGHRTHIARGAVCADCHPGVEASTSAARTFLPDMATCVACHTRQGASVQCATCHPTGPDGRLKTALPAGPLMPTTGPGDHRGDLLRSHRMAATADPDSCATCHAPSTCDRCHVGHIKPLSLHPFDYVRTHGIEAARDTASCAGCHRAQTFCLDCHVRSGVSIVSGPAVFGATVGGARFHPAGFVGQATEPAGPNHHRYAARRNMQSCASCHQETDCVVCHAADAPAGLGAGSPHPPGFDCGRALDVAARGCLKCHRDLSALEQACGR